MSIQRSTSFQYEYKGDLISPSPTFYTYKIEGKKVTINPFSEKTKGKGKALASLKTLEEISLKIRSGELEACCSLEEFQAQAKHVYEAYRKKVKSLSWIKQHLPGVEKESKKVEELYRSICEIAKAPDLSLLPPEVLKEIYRHLPLSDLLKLRRVDKTARVLYFECLHEKAIEIGYEGPKNLQEVETFLQKISKEVTRLYTKGLLNTKVLIFEKNSSKLDPFATFANLNNLSEVGVLILFCNNRELMKDLPLVKRHLWKLIRNKPVTTLSLSFSQRKVGRELREYAVSNDLEAVEVLLRMGVNVNDKSSDGRTALLEAVYQDHTKMVELLLAYKADPNIVAWNGCYPITPLTVALWRKQDEITKLLVNNGSTLTCLRYAYRQCQGSKDILKFLIEKNVPIEFGRGINGRTLLIDLVRDGDLEAVKLLLNHPQINLNDRDTFNNTALHLALSHGRTEVAELLVRKGADCTIRNIDNLEPYGMANRSGFTSMVEWMLFHNSHLVINDNLRNQDRLLDYAIERGHERVVLRLQGLQEEDGADAVTTWATILREGQLSDKMKEKALQQAVIDGNLELIKFFIAKGISLEGVNDDGNTLLHIAARNGQTEVVKYLISLKPRGWKWDVGGMTPVSYAMANNHQELGLLLSHHQLALTS